MLAPTLLMDAASHNRMPTSGQLPLREEGIQLQMSTPRDPEGPRFTPSWFTLPGGSRTTRASCITISSKTPQSLLLLVLSLVASQACAGANPTSTATGPTALDTAGKAAPAIATSVLVPTAAYAPLIPRLIPTVANPL
jgi:hypothetical protein